MNLSPTPVQGTTTTVNGDLSATATTTPRVAVLFSSRNHPENNTSTIITVDALSQALTAWGLTGEGKFVVYAVYLSVDGSEMETPLYQDGEVVALSALHNRLWLQTEGTYRVKAVGVPRYSAMLTCTPTTRPPIMSVSTSGGTQVDMASPAKVLFTRLSDSFAYTNANTIVPFTDTRINTASPSATFDADSKVLTVVEGVWHVSAQCRVVNLVGGTYFELSLMSGLNVVARDRFTWGTECSCSAVSMMVDTLVSSAQADGKALHVQFATDADTSNAFFYPQGTKIIATRVGAAS